VAKLLELRADPFVVNHIGLTALLNAEGNWAAVPRPSVALGQLQNESMYLWEDETKGGWRHRLRAPSDRLRVVDMLKEAMGNRSYGRGADPYCGGVDFEDEWDEWNEAAEHYNPLSRKREFKTSLPPPRNVLEPPLSSRPVWNCGFEKDVDADIEKIWQRDKWLYYEQFPDESMSGPEGEEEEHEIEDSVDSGKDEGQLITSFDPAGGPDGGQVEGDLLGGPLLNDDGQDAQGVATLPSESDENSEAQQDDA